MLKLTGRKKLFCVFLSFEYFLTVIKETFFELLVYVRIFGLVFLDWNVKKALMSDACI